MICKLSLVLLVAKRGGFFFAIYLGSSECFRIFVCGLFIRYFFVIYCSSCCETRRFFFAYKGKFIRQIFAYVGYYCYLCSIIIILTFKISVMNSYLQKSVEERLELELRAFLSAEYFDELSLEDRVDIITSLFKCFEQYLGR